MKIKEALNKIGEKSTLAIGAKIIEMSLEEVPEDTGKLKESHYIEYDKESNTTRIGYNADYAFAQHEEPFYQHDKGKWKYLEDPIKSVVDDISKVDWG